MHSFWNSWWDIRQDGKIAVNRARTSEVSAHVLSVDVRIERLTLINLALWEIVRDSTNLTDDDLRRKIEEIDLRDGKLDGKLSAAPEGCSACGRKIGRRHQKCIYCGAPSTDSPIGK